MMRLTNITRIFLIVITLITLKWAKEQCFKYSNDMFLHKNHFQKIVKSSIIWSHHHVDLLWDHPEPETVEILKNLQQIKVLSVMREFLQSMTSYILRNGKIMYRVAGRLNTILGPYFHLSSAGLSGIWSSSAIWLTNVRAPELIHSWNPPWLNSEPSTSIWNVL